MLKTFSQKYQITDDDTLIVACSWGPDSMFLVSEILSLHPKNHVIVAHFNHHLRWAESDRDELFVKDFCEKNNLIVRFGWSDIENIAREAKKWIEETARTERYAFLENIRQEHRAKYILTGHHLDDTIETLLFNFIRGTKINGLTGIPELNGYILRPLLHLPKSDILTQLQERNISHCIDSTNIDDRYLRNHLRLNVISEFERINPEYRKNLDVFMSYMGELRTHLDGEVREFLSYTDSFSVVDFQKLSTFLQREVVRYLYEQANSGTIGLSEGNIAEVIRFIGDKGNYTKKELGKLRLEKKNNQMYIIL